MIFAHFQDGPAQGRVDTLPPSNKVPPKTIQVAFGRRCDLQLPSGTTNPLEFGQIEYRALGGWADKWWNQHVTYIPTEYEYGYTPIATEVG